MPKPTALTIDRHIRVAHASPGRPAPLTVERARAVTPPDEDADAVTAVLRGDVEAYHTLVRRYQSRLFRYALRMTDDGDVAADLVQMSLIRGFERLQQCRDPGRFGSWVLAILANECRHALRRQREHLPIDDRRVTSVAGSDSPSSLVEQHELAILLRRALRCLPVQQREAFLLHHAEGLSYEQMVAMTRASVAALKQRVHRARESMSVLLEKVR